MIDLTLTKEQLNNNLVLHGYKQGNSKESKRLAATLNRIIDLELEEQGINSFSDSLNIGIKEHRVDPNIVAKYNIELLETYLEEPDLLYLGAKTLNDRYLLRTNEGKIIETISYMFMRIAMGLANAEENPNERAIEFYRLYMSGNFMSSTPTLFNSATLRPQLSSCYLTTIPDDLKGIYKSISDDAMLSKYAGGIGNDWSAVRGLGAHIYGTNGKSQGVIPFMKVVNDTAVAVNQGGNK